MREPNLCFPSQNRAAVCITSALYDRRALDCTATLPLVNSLTHLAYLTSTSPRIREILCLDGGIERLVRILLQSQQQPPPASSDKLTIWKWTLAFQSIVNVGVRGTEQIRTKVVEVGTIPFIINVLSQYIKTHEISSSKKNTTKNNKGNNNTTTTMNNTNSDNNNTTATAVQDKELLDANSSLSPSSATTTTTTFNTNHNTNTPTLTTPTANTLPSFNTSLTNPSASSSTRLSFKQRRRSTFPYVKIDPQQRRHRRIHKQQQQSQQQADSILNNSLFQREEDILLCLQLLAYLSKYPHVRDLFHTAFDKNVFSVVEKFCCSHRFHSTHPQHHTHSNSNNSSATNGPIQYWAGVIMRNACRRDDSKGGLRRCANLSCGKWETQPREFAKCRRCRKAKYCSKPCQSKAWADGHRWWCVERTATTTTSTGNSATITAASTTNLSIAGTPTTTTSLLPTAAVAATNAAIMAAHTNHATTEATASVINQSNNDSTMSQSPSNDDDDDGQEMMPRNTGFSFITRVPDQLVSHQMRQQQQPSTSNDHTSSSNNNGNSTSSSSSSAVAAAAAVAASTNATDNTTSFMDMSVHMEL